MAIERVFEGTWEEVSRQADHFAGKHVRLVVVEGDAREPPETRGADAPFYSTATPEERARAWDAWCALPRPRVPPLSDEAISRERIYSAEGE